MRIAPVSLTVIALLCLRPVQVSTAASDETFAGAPCESLASLTLAGGRVTAAAPVAAGAFRPPGATGGAGVSPAYAALPAFCRIEATLTPTADSDIKVEVWLPASNWNGKLQAVGNGGWAGTIPYGAMA